MDLIPYLFFLHTAQLEQTDFRKLIKRNDTNTHLKPDPSLVADHHILNASTSSAKMVFDDIMTRKLLIIVCY